MKAPRRVHPATVFSPATAGLALSAAAAGQAALVLLPGWGGVAAGVLSFVLAARLWRKGFPQEGKERIPLSPRTEMFLAGAILLLAVFLRFWRLEAFPNGVYLDPARIGFNALRILHEGAWPAGRGPLEWMPADHHLLLVPWFAVFPPGQVSLFSFTALVSVAGLLMAYPVFRLWGGPRQALLAVFLLAVMRWHVVFSRNGYPENLGFPLLFLALWSGAKALETRKGRYFVLLAASLAGSLAAYQAFKPVFLLALVLLVREWGRHPAWKNRTRDLVFTAGWTFLLALPVLLSLARGGGFDIRESEVSVLRVIREQGSLAPLWDNLKDAVGIFQRAGDMVARHNLPGLRMLDDATGMLFILGFFTALARLGERDRFGAVSGLLVMSLPALLSDSGASSNRLIAVTPFVAYLAASPLAQMWDSAAREPAMRRIVPWLTGTVLAAVLLQNAYLYFRVQAEDPACRMGYAARETAIARLVAERCPPGRAFLSPWLFRHPTVRFLTYGCRDRVHEFTDGMGGASADRLGGILFAVPWEDEGARRRILRSHPGVEEKVYVDHRGVPTDRLILVPPELR